MNLTLGVAVTDPRVTNAVGAASATKFSTTFVSNLTFGDSATTQTVTNGLGTLNVASYDSYFGQANTISTLTDTSLTNLSISGTGALTIGVYATDLASSLTINNTSTSSAYSTITNLTDNNLSSLTLTGNGLFGDNGTPTAPAIAQTFTINDANSVLTLTNNNSNPLTVTTLSGIAVPGTTGGPGVTSLTFAGTSPITVSTLTLTGTSLETITSTDSGLVKISSLSDTFLGNLNINGTGNVTITTMDGTVTKTIIDNSPGTLTISADTAADTSLTLMNNSSGVFTYAAGTQAALTTATLVGNVGLTVAGAIKLATVSGASDNTNNTIGLGISTAATDPVITLGNGNNVITDTSATLGGTFTLGSGTNSITIGAQVASGKTDTVTFAPHTGGNNVTVCGGADSTEAQYIIGTTTANGVVAGDTITFAGVNGWATSGTVAALPQFAAAPGTLTANIIAVTALVANGGMAAYGVASFTMGGSTYVVSDVLPGTGAATTCVVLLSGIHTISNDVNGVITILS